MYQDKRLSFRLTEIKCIERNFTMKRSTLYLRRITISAVFLSISLVLKTAFSFHIPMFGENGISVGISGIFSIMPSILFGPVYGAVVSGLSDFLGYLLKPMGAYMPLLTLTAAAGGFLRGLIWSFLRGKNGKKMRIAVITVSAVLLLVGICNTVFLASDGVNNEFYDNIQDETVSTDDMHMISKMLITRTCNTKNPAQNLATCIVTVTTGMIGSGIFGLLLLLADFIISKKIYHDTESGQVPRLLIAMLLSGMIVTTLNTVILRETIYASWKVLPFAIVWFPRAIEELLSNTVKAYFVAVLYKIFCKQRSLKKLINDLPCKKTDGTA